MHYYPQENQYEQFQSNGDGLFVVLMLSSEESMIKYQQFRSSKLVLCCI